MLGYLLFIVVVIVIVIITYYVIHRDPRLPDMEDVAHKIMVQAAITPPHFIIRRTGGKTRTKTDLATPIIYLRTHKGKKPEPYDHQTIMYALVYQLSYLISPPAGTRDFYTTLDRVSLAAKQLGVYDPWASRDPTYPE